MSDVSGIAALQVVGLSKTYGSTRALRNVSITLRAGEVRALLGKNGAGKSTLVNLISGSETPDAGGAIRLNGVNVQWDGPAAARSGGIAVVHQEFSLVPGLTVAENISLGRWPRRARFGAFIDARKTEAIARAAVKKLGADLPLWRRVESLPLAQRQLVEIAKALAFDPSVLILDEPTSALNSREADALLLLVRRLASQGVAVIYVSHRMQEIPRVADTLTVLRDGAEVATMDVGAASSERVAELIAGESGTAIRGSERRDVRDAPIVLSVESLSKRGLLESVSFDLHEGEVLGLAGLLGSGRTEILETIFGTRKDVAGRVTVSGESISKRSPSSMLRRGVGMTSEDRHDAGIFALLGVGENMLFTSRLFGGLWIHPRREKKSILEQIDELSIVTATTEKPIGTLSGGNQQKAVIGRLLAANMRVLLLDEPTRGIDVHAKSQIYRLIRNLAAQGVACIFVSSELEELTEVCDRVLVVRDGRITDEVLASEATTEMLLALTMKEGNDVQK